MPRYRPLAAAIWAGALSATLGAAPALPPVAPVSDPDLIFSRARETWAAAVCPYRLDYVITVAATIDGHRRENHFNAVFFAREHALHVASISEEDVRNPPTPHGTNIAIPFLSGLSPREPSSDLVGVPLLEPTYAFGLAPVRAQGSHAQAPSPQPSGLRVIGSVGTVSRTYAVQLAGTVMLDGQPAFDLTLRPLRDPHRNRVRELWVDRTTFATRALRSEGNFAAGPGTGVPWMIRYATDGDCMTLVDERALGSLDYGSTGTFEDTTISFTYDRDPKAFHPSVFTPDDAIVDNALREP